MTRNATARPVGVAAALFAALLAGLALVPARADEQPPAAAPAFGASAGATPRAGAAEPRPAAEQGAAAVTPARLRAALRRYAHEPDVHAVLRAALEAARAEPARAQRLADRARRSGWVPRVSFGVRHDQGRDLSEREYADGDRTSFSTDDGLTLDGSLTFDLGRIVFASQEVSLLREQRALREERAELVETVVRIYYERRRLQLERDLLGRYDLDHTLRIAEAEALLDAFTDGAFGRMMGRLEGKGATGQ